MQSYIIIRVKGDWESNQIEWVGADGSAWVLTDKIENRRVWLTRGEAEDVVTQLGDEYLVIAPLTPTPFKYTKTSIEGTTTAFELALASDRAIELGFADSVYGRVRELEYFLADYIAPNSLADGSIVGFESGDTLDNLIRQFFYNS